MCSLVYLGNRFKVWKSERTWLWYVADPHHHGGMIGAASSKIEALREACSSIEDVSAEYLAAAQIPCAARETSADAVGCKIP
jgi:hypothetical protein